MSDREIVKSVESIGFDLEKGVVRVQGGRDHQEDEFCITDYPFEKEKFAIYSVFDGHGSEYYSTHAAKYVNKFIMQEAAFLKGDYLEALEQAFHKENEVAQKELFEKGKTGGTTATVAVVRSDCKIFVANVGDSSSVLAEMKENGEYEAIRISKDHSATDKKEKQRVREVGGEVSNGRVRAAGHAINMTRALGDFEFKAPFNKASGDFISPVPHLTEITLTPRNEFLVLATDGLWNAFPDNEVVQKIAKMKQSGMSPDAICSSLVKNVSKEPHSDNITVIVVFFNWHTDGVDKVKTHKLRLDADPLMNEFHKSEAKVEIETVP